MLCNIAILGNEILRQALRDAAIKAAKLSGGRTSNDYTALRAVTVIYDCTAEAVDQAGLRRLNPGEWPAANVVIYIDGVGSCYTLKEGE